MKKSLIIVLLLSFAFSISSFGVHKFYMGIYQINYASEKKMLQVTSRIFIDDLNKALEKKYNRKFFIGTDKENPESLEFLKKYFAENFSIKVNGKAKTMSYLSKEADGDALVCYLRVKNISKISSLEISNSMLVSCFPEQQNIVHVMAFDTKQSILFNEVSTTQMLKF